MKKDHYTIMIVDDDAEIREVLTVLLINEAFTVVEADSGEQALHQLDDNIDLIILDVMMKGMSGYQTAQRIRNRSNIPILFLTAMSQSSDLILGYSCGGDDYLVKPFSYSELMARVKGLLRRYTVYQGKQSVQPKFEYLEWENLRLDLHSHMAWKNGEELNLTSTEYRILRLFLEHPRKIFSAQNIYESVWEDSYFPSDSNTIMVFMRKLRNKIEDNPSRPIRITTVWGKGYRLV